MKRHELESYYEQVAHGAGTSLYRAVTWLIIGALEVAGIIFWPGKILEFMLTISLILTVTNAIIALVLFLGAVYIRYELNKITD